MLLEGFHLFFMADYHEPQITSNICFSLCNIIMNTVNKISLNQHFKVWKWNKNILPY